ncbi:MAG: glycoside hydrolase [Chloroflexi bacterium]|nr:glycoside hydrolase [Chloroflexota bacterium]
MARIDVDCGRWLGPLRRIWASIGYDEINFTYTGRGKRLYRTLRDVFDVRYSVRNHNALTSSNGLSGPAWGGGNVYHEDAEGQPRYYWGYLDQIYDTILGGNGIPLIELGFMPQQLSSEQAPNIGFGAGLDVGKEPYEAGAWKYPPKDWDRWEELIYQTVRHCVERYGEEEVARWKWEVWNEPDIRHYWHGTFDEYCKLYDYAARGAKRAFPRAQFGGPATTHRNPDFLLKFLEHVTEGRNYATGEIGSPIDFISFHTKGAFYDPRRSYNPFVELPEQSPSTPTMLGDIQRSLGIIARFPTLAGLPCLVDECDPAVGTVYGVYDNPDFEVCNTPYYASFVCALARRLLDISPESIGATGECPRVDEFTSWAFYMEGKRWFEGNRSLVTNENVEGAIVNGFRMLSRMAGTRVALSTDARTDPLADGFSWSDREVDGLAAMDADRVTVMVWHHADRWRETGTATVDLTLSGIAFAGETAMLRHWRIDGEHSNAHGEWVRLGKPEDPTPVQLERLTSRMGLEQLSPPAAVPVVNGQVTVRFELPLHGVSLLELRR